MPQGVELATAWVRVVPTMDGVSAAVNRGLAPAQGAADAAGKKFGGRFTSGVAGQLKALAGPLVGVFAAKQVLQGIKSTITAASDLKEAGTAVHAVFGASFEEIEHWSKGAATAFGLSDVAALDAAKTFGVYGQSAGLAGKANAEFATGMAELAGDLASFHNTSTDEAIVAIGAALRGEQLPIRRFGVLLDDLSLRNKAFAMGLTNTTKKVLTPQQRVLAAHALILEQTKVAQGDFAKTQGGLANQGRILSAQWENLSAQLGQFFLPAVEGVAHGLTGFLMPALSHTIGFLSERLGPALKAVFSSGSAGELAKALDVPANSPVVAVVTALREGFQQVQVVAKPFLGALVDMGKTVGAALVPAFQQVWAALAPLIPTFLDVWMNASPLMILFKAITPLLPTIAGLFAKIADVLGGVLATALPIIVKLATKLSEVIGSVLAAVLPIVSGLLEALVPIFGMLADVIGSVLVAVLPVVTSLFDALVPALTSIVDAILPIVSAVIGVLMPVLQILITVLQKVVEFILPILIPVIQFLGAVVGAIFTAIGAVLTWLWESIGKPIFDALAGALNWIATDVLGGFGLDWDTIMKAAGLALDVLWKRVIQPTFRAIGDIFNWIWANVIQPVIGFITGSLEGWGVVVDFVGKQVNTIWTGIGVVFNTVRDVISKAIENVTTVIKGVQKTFETVVKGIKDAFAGIGKFISDAFGGVGDFLRSTAGAIGSFFSGVGDKARSFKGRLKDAKKPKGNAPGGGGIALARVRATLPAGLHVTDTLSSPARDRALGLVRSPNSYHYDAKNPAVDIAGPIPLLFQYAKRLMAMGGWRQFLWQVPGHYDHIHVAHQGGVVESSWPRMFGDAPDERTARLQVGETVLPRGYQPPVVTPFVPDDDDRRGAPGPAVEIRGDVYTTDIDAFFEEAERARRRAYAIASQP